MHTLGLFIDRIQPPTPEFAATVRRACAAFGSVLVLVAGAQRPRSPRDPMSWTQRAAILEGMVKAPNLVCMPLVDALYDDGLWVSHVRRCVDALEDIHHMPADVEFEVTLCLANDAQGRAVARLFPGWTPAFDVQRGDTDAALSALMAGPITTLLNANACAALARDSQHIAAEQAKRAAAEAALGYAIPFQAVDAVVIQSHHVLLARRPDGEPGAGLLCLPGAFLAPRTTALDTALTAVRTKAGLDMPTGALSGRLTTRKVFDHPDRDPRGWIRTEAFVFELSASGRMETAKKAAWTPLSHLCPSAMFADHFDIVQSCARGVVSPQDSLLMGLSPTT